MKPSCLVHIVDDEEPIRSSLSLLIECWGCRVRVYESGADLLAADLPGASDFVIVDVRMPGMGGLAAMDALRARGCSAPVIIMTGHAEASLAEAALAKRASAYLEKPFSSDDLQRAMRAVTPCCSW